MVSCWSKFDFDFQTLTWWERRAECVMHQEFAPHPPHPHLLALNSTTHSCTHFPCHGVNLFVRSRLLEICPSDLVNVRVAGLAVVPQGVRGSVCARVCTPSAIGGGIYVLVRVCVPLVSRTLFSEGWGMLRSRGTDTDTQGSVCILHLKANSISPVFHGLFASIFILTYLLANMAGDTSMVFSEGFRS